MATRCGYDVYHDFSELPYGGRYEDTYGKWLDLFHSIAMVPKDRSILVRGAPHTWCPLLFYLGCTVSDPLPYFAMDYVAQPVLKGLDLPNRKWPLRRTLLEVLCALRPETADALFKVDCEWSTDRRWGYAREDGFPVTNNASFFRRELLDFTGLVSRYFTSRDKFIIMPCAADKPYPAEIHKRVMSLVDDSWELLVVSGALGVVPQSLWPRMPLYDAGVPNEWKVVQSVVEFFDRHRHASHVLCLTDFNNLALDTAFSYLENSNRVVARRVDFRFRYEPFIADVRFYTPVRFYYGYTNLFDKIPELEEDIRCIDNGS